MAVVKAEKLRSEAKREGVDHNPTPTADQEMAELVEKNHQAQDKKERQYISCERPDLCE
jgi:hypothetical protein